MCCYDSLHLHHHPWSLYVNPTTACKLPVYNTFDHLRKTLSQIYILYLLKSSLVHQEILTKALQDTHVPNSIDPTQFQALVGHLSATYQLTFNQNDMSCIGLNHNHPLHIEVLKA